MAVGSVYIARAPGTNLITNIDGTEQQLTYDTEVETSADITRQSGNQAFRIQNSGRYLIIVNTRFDYVDIENNNRHVMRSLIKIGGAELGSIYGEASGYGRDSGNADEDGTVVVAYVDHTVVGSSADDITVHVQNFGDTSVSLADQIADQSGIQIVRLPDSSAYLKVNRTTNLSVTGTLDYSINDGTWNEFGWETQDAETDSGVIEWVSGNDITLKEAGNYLVIYGISHLGSGANRRGCAFRLKLDDTEIPASRTHCMSRSSDGSIECWSQWAGVINTSSTNQVLNIDWMSTSETSGSTIDEACMTVIRLPDTAETLKVYYDSSRAGETTGVFPFNQEDFDTAGIHDNVTNNSRISGNSDNHDWLLFGSWFVRTTTVDSTRTSEHFRWYRNGTEVNYGSGLSYTRGDQSSTGVPAGGAICAIVALALGSSDYMEINLRLESGTGDQGRDFKENTVGISGIALDTLVGATLPEVAPTRKRIRVICS